MCSWIFGTQAWRDRPHPHGRQPGALLPVARLFRQPWERAVSQGTAPGALRYRRRAFRRIIFPRSTPCCGWMDSMAQERSWPNLLATPLSREARTTPCWISPRSRLACICLLMGSSLAKTSTLVRTLYDCPEVAVGPQQVRCRVVVATHPAGQTKSRIGLTRNGVVYELFFTVLPQSAFTAADVVALYLHRGAFEPTLADEDEELDPDRWCSHASAGQEAWQIISQWLWNLRLELGHQLAPTPLRTTEFARAVEEGQQPQGYGAPVVGGSWKAGRFTGQDFTLQPEGTVRCPVGKLLFPCERRKEAEGSLRIVYAARIADCRACCLREQCQWRGHQTHKPRQMSVLLHPLQIGSHPLLWRDWHRRQHRRACLQLLRHQRVTVQLPPASQVHSKERQVVLTRAQRAHSRLSWQERLARNARAPEASPPTISLFGIPDHFAAFLGLKAA